MKITKSLLIAFLCTMIFSSCASYSNKVVIDAVSDKKIDSILQHQVIPNIHAPVGEKIDIISAQFLGTPYVADTLIGSPDTPEKLLVDVMGVDCFTFIDYVEALQHSTNKNDFFEKLIKTRYIDREVDFLKRKHFFTDWAYRNSKNAQDITSEIDINANQVDKLLNKKSDGGEYIPGLGVTKRKISFIPGSNINQKTVENLRTGDFIGIYTNTQGLDVTHVGIFIMTKNGPVFRNASSLEKNRKVVDTIFLDYMKNKPGIIVLRPYPDK